jgi:hypothetical protein
MVLLLLLQVFISSSCLDTKDKIDVLLRYGIVPWTWNRRNTAVELPYKLAKEYNQNYIYYDKYGFPRFEVFALAIIDIEPSGDRIKDREYAERVLGLTNTKYLNKLTWHHTEDTRHLLLLPRELHELRGVEHIGGIGILKRRGKNNE